MEIRRLDARLTTTDGEEHVRVADLSLGGTCLRCRTAPTAGEHVGIAMQLERRAFALGGTVAWWNGGPHACAGVEFDRIDASTRRALANAMIAASILAEESADRGAGVLLMLGDGERQLAVARELAGNGVRPLPVATPLEAVRWLADETIDIRVAIVSCDLPATAGQDVLSFLSDEYPDIARVVLDPSDHSSDAEVIVNAVGHARLARSRAT